MKILVIEDDDEAAAYLVKGLSESGHQVDLAVDGRQGLDHAANGEFDALVVDRMRPELDGLAIISELRANGISLLYISHRLEEVFRSITLPETAKPALQ